MLHNGVMKELYTDDMDHPVCVEAFTLPEAAKALGRSELGVKRWVADGIIPPPYLRDTIRNFRHYSAGELRVIARVLKEHEEEFRYLSAKHTVTIHTMWQAVQAFRAHSV